MGDKGRKYLINAVMLSVVSVAMRAVAVSFNAYVTKKIGAEGIGLFGLVMTVYNLAVTLAVSGVNLAAVRMTSERLALCRESDMSAHATKRALRREMRGCILYSLIFGALAALLLYSLAEPIGKVLLGDCRTVSSLRLCAPALPAISLSSALAGYFTGLRKVYKNAVISLSEQAVKITLTSAALVIIAPRGIEYACLSVVGGAAICEGASLILSFIFYVTDRGDKTTGGNDGGAAPSSPLRRAASIALPVALGSYVRQGLTCAEHIAIPAGLRRFHLTRSGDALSTYGVLHGMALPLILFPSSVIGAFTSLLIPELSECHALKMRETISEIAGKCLKFGIIFSAAAGGIFLAFGRELGEAIYQNSDAGRYVVAFAPLVPVMYLDSAVDAVLKGVEQQLYCMRVNILDASLSLLLVLILVPRMGCTGYIICVYITEGVNAVLSISKMIAVTRPKILPSAVILPPLLIAAACTLCRAVSAKVYTGTVGSQITVCLVLYSAFMLCMAAFSRIKSVKTEKEAKCS